MLEILTQVLTNDHKKMSRQGSSPRRDKLVSYPGSLALGRENLFNVFAGVFRQLKHVGRAFSSKEGLEQLVCVNHAPVLFVL